jgi:NAD+---dinitrogen-reductase ADP-D-ribosyltransferase
MPESFPHILNLCNLSPWAIADRAFQQNPQALEINGVVRTDGRLFRHLETIPDPSHRGRVFHEYLSVKFGLHTAAAYTGSARKSIRQNYIQFILGWQSDSNGLSGAVLKGWVESRFGLPTLYHGGVLERDPEARQRFAHHRMQGAARTIAVAMQLDLLYTFCQFELSRRYPETSHLRLFRGTHDPEEYEIRQHADKKALVRLNNLSSFTSNIETAWEFGSLVWEAEIPLSKIIFFSGLLPTDLLAGESEFLVLGGDIEVRTRLW